MPEYLSILLAFALSLIPAVVQDAATGEVLMVGFMNEQALARTRETGYATFFSRTRGTLWTKGETSRNRLRVARMRVDCDEDTVLLEVTCEGDGVACHTGERSCFFRELTGTAAREVSSLSGELNTARLAGGELAS